MSTLTATNLPGAAGNAKTTRWQIKIGKKTNLVVSGFLLAAFTYGSIELWLGVWRVLYAGKVFPGASPLLILGSLFPFFRGNEAYEHAKDGKNPPEVRVLFSALALIALFNMFANAICIGWAVGLQAGGGAPWTEYDTWVMVSGGFAGVVVIGIWRKKSWAEPKSRFYWVISWRTIPILALTFPAFVTGAVTMPDKSALGLVLIALVALLFVVLQVISVANQAKTKEDFEESYHRLQWLLWAEAANFGASLILLAVLATH